MKEFVKRRPLIALILTFFSAGLGQLYNGQLQKAVFLYVLSLILIIIVSFSGLFFSFFGMIIIFTVGIGYLYINLNYIIHKHLSWSQSIWSGLIVFLPGEIIKIIFSTSLTQRLDCFFMKNEKISG